MFAIRAHYHTVSSRLTDGAEVVGLKRSRTLLPGKFRVTFSNLRVTGLGKLITFNGPRED
jgi:hypothetical protein